MKVKKIIFGLIITLLVLIIGIGENIVLATGETTKTLCLSYARYVYDGTDFVKKGAYAVSNGHNIYQIMDTSTNMPLKNIYCLDAPTSYTWNYQIDDTGEIKEESGNINTPATYNRSYNMVKDNDIIKKLAVTNYNKVNNSKYYGQILWLLDNAYVEGTDKNKNEEDIKALLGRVGIKKTTVLALDTTETVRTLYYAKDRWIYAPQGYEEAISRIINNDAYKTTNSSGETRYIGSTELDAILEEIKRPSWVKYGDESKEPKGYSYKDKDGNTIECSLPAELVESVQQAALWYYVNGANYDYYTGKNASGMKLWLNYSIGSNVDNREYKPLASYYYNSTTGNIEYSTASGLPGAVGQMYQEQACLLYDYLIDSANAANPGDNNAYANESTKNPLIVNASTNMKKVNSKYVVGPIKLEKVGELPYILENNLVVKDQDNNTISGWYLSDENGNARSITDYSTLVGETTGFYVTVPTTTISGVKISLNGTYQITEKTLWMTDESTTDATAEQLLVEITKKDEPFELNVNAADKKTFDLKLVKYISEINGDATRGRTVTKIDSSKLKDGSKTTADYTLSKDPLKVKTGEYVTYTLRVYNEAELDGYAEEITEDIPNGLEYIYDNGITIDATGNIDYSACTKTLTDEDKKAIEFNLSQGWTIKTTNATTNRIEMVKTDYLSKAKSTSNEIKAFDVANDDGKGSGLSYKEVKIMLKVVATDPTIGVIRNEAAITKDSDDDRDSNPDEWKKYEDDEDYDNVILEEYDIALRKFIAAISNDANIEEGEYVTVDGTTNTAYTRAPSVDTTHLKDKTATTAIYKHPKDSLTVARESYVLYTIRVYNEGDIDAYASKITDHLPTYLDYVECEFNDNYGWVVGADGKTVSTDYLSSEKDKKNILKAFDSVNDDGKGSGLDYKDVQILCKVNKNALPMKNITNIAQITEYQGKDGTVVPKDRDSKPDNLTDDVLNQDDRPDYEGGEDTDKTDGYIPGQEDDDDFERIVVREFDLALLKYVSEVHVIEDGNETVTQTGNTGNNTTDMIPKVEINRKKLDSTIVKFVYIIKITNEGDIPGYATEITDYVPEGLKFYEEDNKEWVDEGNNVISTKALKGTLLNPGESANVEVTFRWINGANNLGVKTNYAEISEDYNEYDVPDRDSTPDNKIIEEDDMDYAPVLLAISTGLKENVMPYVGVGGISLIMLAGGIILIKKFVL